MTNRFFFKRILVLSMTFGILSFSMEIFPFFRSIREFTWLSLLFFMLTTVLIYFLSLSGLSRKASFLYYYFGSIFLRFMLSFFLIAGYYYYTTPSEIYFVIPFFFMYIGFTIVETASLMRLVRANG